MTIYPRAALATILLLIAPQAARADSRADWTDYAWQSIDVSTCIVAAGVATCPPYREKWDWKRDQWVDVTISMDLTANTIRLMERLTNNDRHDTDYVCVTALVVDAAGQNLAAHHQNWQMSHGATREKTFTYSAADLSKAASIHIGSKQCRDGAAQDGALYAHILAGIQN